MATTPPAPAPSGPQPTTVHTQARAVQYATAQVQPPSPLYLQPEDNLLLTIYGSASLFPLTVLLLIRWLDPNGTIITTRRPFTSPISSTPFVMNLGEGFLLSASVTWQGLPPPITSTLYATLVIQRDAPDANNFSWVLFADAITNTHIPSWPTGRNIPSLELQPRIRSITGTTPAAGADISETVVTGWRWQLLALRASFVTSANAGNRQVEFTLDDGASVYYVFQTVNSQPASTTTVYALAMAGPIHEAAGAAQLYPIPAGHYLNGGHRIRSLTPGIFAADQWSAPQYLIAEWLDV